MRKTRDIWDYLQIVSGLAVTAFTIYFLVERLRQQKLSQKKSIDTKTKEPDLPKVGVIIE
jgi:hypothetical protein